MDFKCSKSKQAGIKINVSFPKINFKTDFIGTNLYTVCETNVVITDLTAGLMSQVTLGTMPGRAPLLLFGRELIRRGSAIDQQRRGSYIMAEMTRRASNVSEVDANVRHKYLVYATRDGKGFTVAKNEAPFKEILTKAVSI